MNDASAASLSYASGGEIALECEEPRTLAERIAQRVAAKPHGIVRSYREEGRHQARTNAWLWRQAGDIAAALCTGGAGPATPVIILVEDALDFIPCFWACLRAAVIPVGLMNAARAAAHHKEPGFHQAVALLEAPVFLVDEYFAALLPRLALTLDAKILHLAAVAPAPDFEQRAAARDTSYLVATSGSTGQLKLVELSNGAALYRNFARIQSLAPELPVSHALGTFPLDTVTGQHGCFLHHDSITLIGSQTLTMRPTSILDAIEAFDIDVVTLTNSMMNRILADEAGSGRSWRLGALRNVGLGAEPISARVAQEFAALLLRHGAGPDVIIAGYGASETGSLVEGSRALLIGDRNQPVRLGRPWHGVAMRIVDDVSIIPAGEVGEVEIFCPTKMFSNYWGDPSLTVQSFTEDGWWKTGDLGQLIDGELTLRGRAKEVLIQNGRKLSLADIDAEIQMALGVGAVAHAFLRVDPETHGEALGVAFDACETMAETQAVESIRLALVRRFGIQPERIVAIAADRFPRTAAGKVRRSALAQVAADLAGAPVRPAGAQAASSVAPSALRLRLEAIWSEVLGLQRPVRAQDHFFDLGGDSLRAVTLHLQLAERFGIHVTGEEFFADPTFQHLERLVRAHRGATDDSSPPPETPWPLPVALCRGLLGALRHWPGRAATEAGTIRGVNLAGARPPIFWVFNVPEEPAALAHMLGPDQPLYVIRSGHELSGYSEDEIQTFALHYVADIIRLRPTGPLFIGGNCQGSIIALAIAQHLLRRKRHIPLLVLMDWAFELHSYLGRVLFISTADNPLNNPRAHFANPELGWARAFAHHAFVLIGGGYGRGFDPEHIPGLIAALNEHMALALAAPPALMPHSGFRATITVQKPPIALRPGARRTVWISITNDSDIVWAASGTSGLLLSSRWLRHGHPISHPPQPRTAIPRLRPGETAMVKLNLVAPDEIGHLTLVVDAVEEGNRWFSTDPSVACAAPVEVAHSAPWWSLRRIKTPKSLGGR